METSFQVREENNIPESGYPIETKFDGWGYVDSFHVACYIEFQRIPGRRRNITAFINAPYSSLPV